MPYDDDQYGGKQTMIVHIDPRTTVDLDEVVARVQWFNRIKLLEAQAIMVSTAFDETTCTLSLAKDATTFGYIAVAAGTVGTVIDGEITAQTFDTTNSLEIQLGHATATGYCDVVLQYQELFEA